MPRKKTNNGEQLSLDDIVIDNVGKKAPSNDLHKNIDDIKVSESTNAEPVDEKTLEANIRKKLTAPTKSEIEQSNEIVKVKKSRKKKEEEQPVDETINELAILKDAPDTTSKSATANRFNPEIIVGLSKEQVDDRISNGLTNQTGKSYSKTYLQILFNNIFTFFNLLCFLVAAALIMVQSWGDLFFMVIVLSNTAIGIFQEIRAKKTIDRLTIVTAPTAMVRRNGEDKEIPISEMVLDDLFLLKTGKQISADAIIVDGYVEVNESLLTGESVAIKKTVGDDLYSGSFVSSGTCIAKVNKVGKDCYVQKLQSRAKRYSKPKSELLNSLKTIITVIGILIVPLGTFSAISNYRSAQISAVSSSFDKDGDFVVIGYTETNKTYIIGYLDDQITTTESIASVDTTKLDFNALSKITRVGVEYAKKVGGNIGVFDMSITYMYGGEDRKPAEEDETKKLNIVENLRNTISNPKEGWEYRISNTTYEDGSLKLDTQDYYVKSETFHTIYDFEVKVTLKSNGYAKDTPEYYSYIQYYTITKTAGSLIGMIPSGMFLLTTVALAVGVIRLGKRKTLVQELYCIEMLARVDCLCLDKTGTITDGTMRVKEIIDLIKPKDKTINVPIDTIMGSYITAIEDNNQTSIALQNRFGANYELKKKSTLPFSSTRKLSAVTFEDFGTIVLGAPEYVYQGKSKKLNEIIQRKTAMGYRVLMVAHSPNPLSKDGKLPQTITPIAIIVLEDHIRDSAIDTIKWFNDNGVGVKVISGDNPATVAEIAKSVGIIGAEFYVSLEGLSARDVETIASEYTVFGRVSPEQKAILVKALKKKGRTVAMTGDGVNDILAMKEADCSVAMANGSEAARNVSHLVLMDSNFASMPKVVEEGRRVINNIQRSSSLFLMKTLFTMILTVTSIIFTDIFTSGYPFVTKQLMMLEIFVIGIPATALAIQPNNQRLKGNFLKNVFANCLPSAFVLLFSVCIIYFLAATNSEFDLSDPYEIASMCVVCITFIGFIILYNVCRPLNTYRAVIVILMLLCSILIIRFIPSYVGMEAKTISTQNTLLCLVIILASIPIVRYISELLKRIQEENQEKEQ